MCGIRGKTLIINLPGSPKALKECLAPIASVIPHAVDLISNKQADVERVHASHDLTKTNNNDHSCDLPATTSVRDLINYKLSFSRLNYKYFFVVTLGKYCHASQGITVSHAFR